MQHGHRETRRRSLNWQMLLKVTGWLLMIEAAFMLVPMGTSLAYGEEDWLIFAISAAVTAVCGFAMRSIRATGGHMGRREGFLLTASVWVWFSLFGMIPFIFCNQGFSVPDAFFAAMSGFTTTGASLSGSHAHLSYGINIWHAMMQWIGGMGIILFTLAVIPMLNSAGGMQMFNAEVTGITHDKVRPRISSTAKALWGTYFALTILLFFALWLGPMDIYDSTVYALTCISTGGFVGTSHGLAYFGSDYVYGVITLFMFAGGVNFTLIFRSLTGGVKSFWRNEVFRVYVLVILLMFVLIDLQILHDPDGPLTWQSLTIYPLFHVVSIITSTGYESGCFVWWTPLVIGLTIIMMFTGACAGSTTGGAKLDRIVFMAKYLRNEIYRCVRPNAVLSVRIDGRVRSPEIVGKVVAFLCLYVIIIFTGGLVLMAMDMPLLDALFSAFSCMSNTGLGADVTGYGSNFSILPDAGKWLLSALMLIGRLEIFTVLIIFTVPFWRK